MVFNVAAENRGALSILNDFYEEFKKDSSNNYFIVLSKPDLPEIDNIKVLRFPWVKKNWLYRLYFDCFVAGKLVEANNIDEVFSMQNIAIPKIKVRQKIYLHQPLPFVDIRFSLFKYPLLWVYQNIVSKLIYRSIRIADEVIVQTEWMKKACVNRANIIDLDKIKILPPKINIGIKKKYIKNIDDISTFFYPASGVFFKNHNVIIEACKILRNENITNYKVVFSLNGNENTNISKLKDKCLDLGLPVIFAGNLSREEVFEYYSISLLIFPSYIETFGLPLLEAKLHDTPIIASDCPFSHEILDNYNNVVFFNPFNPYELADLMINNIRNIVEL